MLWWVYVIWISVGVVGCVIIVLFVDWWNVKYYFGSGIGVDEF